MSYHHVHGSERWFVVRQRGKGLVHTVPKERYRTKKRAEKEARMFNKAYEGSDIVFSVLKEGWRRKQLKTVFVTNDALGKLQKSATK